MRGGTSRAVFVKEADLPRDPDAREAAILAIFGSPDRRQIDGVAGADPLTSKLAIIGPPPIDRPGAHLTYTFGQVEIERPEIDWRSLCGNISAAVGVFAIQESLAPPTDPVTTVRAYNTNLQRMLSIEVQTERGRPVERGDYEVPGVPRPGARILIDFADTAGAATGAVLPTGRPVDRLDVPGFGPLDASLVDCGNAHVFIRARDVGLTGVEAAAVIDRNADLRALLETIRGVAACRMGMIADPGRSAADSPATPLLAMIGPPQAYQDDLCGGAIDAAHVDVVSRLMFMQQAHKTYAGTSTVCTGVASRLPGTIVHELARPGAGRELRIGHPAGVIETETVVDHGAVGPVVRRATLGRTARRIMEGRVFLPEEVQA
jgi:2-methylaconitate cis-trans-isomerase PrpF